jgi:hypothetical protein
MHGSKLPWATLFVAASLLAAAAASAGGLNDRNRLEDGSLGLPLESLFKERPNSLPYKPVGEEGETTFLPPLIKRTPEPPRGTPKEPEAPLGSALGGRRER